jgi:hypothetical protein
VDDEWSKRIGPFRDANGAEAVAVGDAEGVQVEDGEEELVVPEVDVAIILVVVSMSIAPPQWLLFPTIIGNSCCAGVVHEPIMSEFDVL